MRTTWSITDETIKLFENLISNFMALLVKESRTIGIVQVR